MIEKLDNIEVINSFLKEFNQSITNLNDPFKRYIGYKVNDKFAAFLNYSLLYDRIEIEYIYTITSFRNKHIATKLLDYLIKIGLENKCINITLEVRKSNVVAKAFYKKNGFKEVSVRRNYYKNEDGILMLRELV